MSPAPLAEVESMQARRLARFKKMKLDARPMSDGLSILVSLALGPAPFESVAGPLALSRVVFTTVGGTAIKCLRPRALFGLPLIDIRHCDDGPAIEWEIRQAWRERTRALRETVQSLRDKHLDVAIGEGNSVVGFTLPGETPNARIRIQQADEAILPSTGPLSGLCLEGREERLLDIGDCMDSGAELECRLGSRVDALREIGLAREEQARARPVVDSSSSPSTQHSPGTPNRSDPSGAPTRPARPASTEHYQPKVMLVGPALTKNAELRAELSRRGYQAVTTQSESEALTRLASMSPELILSQYALGRSDGASFVQAMHGLPGIERIPVVLIDQSHHDGRKEAARAVGAAGYLITPLQTEKFVSRLGRLVTEPTGRRFKRYPGRFSARLQGIAESCIATEVGRGGIFLATNSEVGTQNAMHGRIHLPEIGRDVDFEGEVLYTAESRSGRQQGLGLRFFGMSGEDETALIRYLAWLEDQAPHPDS